MTELKKVEALLSQNMGKWLCDGCVQEALGFARRARSNKRVLAIVRGSSSLYERQSGECSACGDALLVTRRKPDAAL